MLLPAAPHSEADGTFVNFEGRAQRFELAYFPRGAAVPHFLLAAQLGSSLGLAWHLRSASEVWKELGARLGEVLPTYAFQSLPARRPGLTPFPAGTVDGRLPGYRERVPEDASGDARLDLIAEQGRRPA